MSFQQQTFSYRSAQSFPWSSRSNENEGLCNECAKLNLEQSFDFAFELYEGSRRGRNSRTVEVYRSDDGPPYLGYFHYVTSLGDRLSCVSHCKLCNFFRQTTPDPNRGTFKLLAFCASESYLFEAPKKDSRGKPEKRPWGLIEHNVFMAVVPEVSLIPKIGVPLRWLETELPKTGAIYRVSELNANEDRLALPRELGSKADIRELKFWLHCCRTAHDCCAPRKPAGASLPGFRAIDCTRNPPVVEERPWSQKYVALSYVWGPQSGDWPQTILDAVEMTKNLGEKYLWVDRLCINQSNLQEKQFLISKMDAIYEGAEFTIVAAAGDARTGLPGVMKTPRKPQPRVELKERSRGTGDPPSLDPYFILYGITREEYKETIKDEKSFDMHRFGLKAKMTPDLKQFKKEKEIMAKYGISRDHLEIFQDFADDYGYSIDEFMEKEKQRARRTGIPLTELAPHTLRELAISIGMPAHEAAKITRRPAPPITSSSRIEKPLSPGKIKGKTILVSTLEDPRITIRNSEWATRGWTYQEGVLSNRRLVFTDKQVYWECRGMTMNESLELLDLYDPCGTRRADYMLSGIFDADLHRVPELQYGFKPSNVNEIHEQVLKLDSHIRAFTSRKLTCNDDSLNAFLGVAARYSTNNGLHLLVGMPVFSGLFANGKPGLQDTFALSISAWTHTAQRVKERGIVYVANCSRRTKFPSWTWAGWTGRADFSTTTATSENEDRPGGWADDVHVEFFKAMTSNGWVGGISRRLWSAEMVLHADDGSETTLLAGNAPVVGTATGQSKTWLLTIHDPLVLWNIPMEKRLQVHYSVPMTEAEATAASRSGDHIMVLVFVSTVPFVFNGTARCLVLRKANDARTRWERIGRLAITLEEEELNKYKTTAAMIAEMPVRKFGREIVLI